MELVYDVYDKPKGLQLIFLALQQMLAILAATLAVPMIVGNGLTPASAMFGAGVGTLVYILATKKKSPVFLGSSFAFIGSMSAAFAGASTMSLGMLGIIIGAFSAGLVYLIIAVIVKKVGTKWVDRLMPPVVIGPTVSIIGLSLAGNAVSDLQSSGVPNAPVSQYISIVCGLITLIVTMCFSVYGKKFTKLIPFILGIAAGYFFAAIFTAIGFATKTDEFKIIDFSVFAQNMMPKGHIGIESFVSLPDFVFTHAAKGFKHIYPAYFATVLVAYIPVALVVFAEHIADHKNLSSVIGRDLLKDPGLSATLTGDGLGSAIGAFFGGCPNTTYGESVGCVAITGNASTITIAAASVGCIMLSFFTPFIAFVQSIPSCVMGGICIALYGFIAVSGFKMIQKVDLDDHKNLFTVAVILICGIGGFSMDFGAIKITEVASALILGMITNKLLTRKEIL